MKRNDISKYDYRQSINAPCNALRFCSVDILPLNTRSAPAQVGVK